MQKIEINIEIKKKRIIDEGFHIMILDIIKISLKVLMEGGADILIIKKRNHHMVMLGKIWINPLNREIFREWYFVYIESTNKNKPEDDKPCAIIIIIAPYRPCLLNDKRLANTKAI